MRKLVIVAVVVILILVVGGLMLAEMGSKNSNPEPATSTAPSSSNSNTSNSSSNESSSSAVPVATDTVSIADMAFNPADIKVKAGTKVTWTNSDNVSHTVTESDGQDGPKSDTLTPGQTYSFTFAKA